MKRPNFNHRAPARRRHYLSKLSERLVDKREVFDWRPNSELVVGLPPKPVRAPLVPQEDADEPR
jgi:hypothetical protein